jgi:acetoin utilization deacetylase AcuC-like enzyme
MPSRMAAHRSHTQPPQALARRQTGDSRLTGARDSATQPPETKGRHRTPAPKRPQSSPTKVYATASSLWYSSAVNEQSGTRPVNQPGLYFSHPACLEHDPRVHMPEHPDTPERLVAIERMLAEHDWLGWERRAAPPAEEAQLELIHSARHVQRIKELSLAGGGAIDPDTFVGEPSYRAALHAAGGACEMTRALIAGEAMLGFCGVRPSGHHAEPNCAMGFCFFNNVAIAAELGIRELGARRVLILDWDVHHGNGTAEAFCRRPDVLFASIHQSGIYPGTGALSDVGSDSRNPCKRHCSRSPGTSQRDPPRRSRC